MEEERLRLERIPLIDAVELLWAENPKLHDMGSLAESIRRHGFRDAPAHDALIQEGGGIHDGNGRILALDWMRKQGQPPPRGVEVDGDGEWLVPVQFGLDSGSQSEAAALAVDINNMPMMGGDLDGFEMARMWDADYAAVLCSLDEPPVTVPGELVEALAKEREAMDFSDTLDWMKDEGQKSSALIKCPACGHEWEAT